MMILHYDITRYICLSTCLIISKGFFADVGIGSALKAIRKLSNGVSITPDGILFLFLERSGKATAYLLAAIFHVTSVVHFVPPIGRCTCLPFGEKLPAT